ncbi:MAG: LamG-like jellyroll fold domain-containing protein [Planctomycetota bacterium]|nr:LamG-like jellyroll fold domain-containing protein [Planctomycetota bacterium]
MRKEGGFTLIEIITILAIFIVLLGLSAAAYMTFRDDMQVRGVAAQVRGMIQAAHNSAVAEQQKTFIVEENTFRGESFVLSRVVGFGMQTVGRWNLDDEVNIADDGVSHGYGGNVNVGGMELVTGRTGTAVKIDGSSLSVPNTQELFTPRDGVSGSMWVKFERSDVTSSRVEDCSLMECGEAYRFFVQEGRLALTIQGNTILSESASGAPYHLIPDRWVHLSFSYDVYTSEMAIFVDKVKRASAGVDLPEGLPLEQSDLMLVSGLMGVVDDIELRGVLSSSEFELPGALAMNVPKELAGSVPYIRSYERGELTIYIKITAFDEKGWLDNINGNSANLSFYNVSAPGASEFSRNFRINSQGLLEVR